MLCAADALAEMMYGIAESCMHGAVEAWVTDSTASDRKRLSVRSVLSGGQTFMLGALTVTSLMAGFVYEINPPSVFLISGGAYALASVSLLVIGKERRRSGRAERGVNGLETCRSALGVIKAERALIVILTATALVGFAGDAVDRYWQINLHEFGVGSEMFGPVIATTTLVGIVLVNIAVRLSVKPLTAIVVIELISAGCLLALIMYNRSLVFAGTIVYMSVRRARYPLFIDFMADLVPDRVRATVFSFNSLMNSVGEIVAGVAFGAIALAFGLRATFGVAATIAAIACVLYGWLIWWRSRSEVTGT